MPVKSIRLSQQEERELVNAAQNSNQSISAYIRAKLFNKSTDKPLDRLTTEVKIERIQKDVIKLYELVAIEHNTYQKELVPFLIKAFDAIGRAEENVDFLKLYREGVYS